MNAEELLDRLDECWYEKRGVGTLMCDREKALGIIGDFLEERKREGWIEVVVGGHRNIIDVRKARKVYLSNNGNLLEIDYGDRAGLTIHGTDAAAVWAHIRKILGFSNPDGG